MSSKRTAITCILAVLAFGLGLVLVLYHLRTPAPGRSRAPATIVSMEAAGSQPQAPRRSLRDRRPAGARKARQEVASAASRYRERFAAKRASSFSPSKDRKLFDQALDLLDARSFEKARLTLQTLVNVSPDSPWTPAALVTIADSYLAQGGSENLLQAQANYKDFLIFYPSHELESDAVSGLVAVYLNRWRSSEEPDADPSQAWVARAGLRKLFEQYPNTELVRLAEQYISEIE